MTILLTGAAGGIGRALCAEFLAAGWRVIATDHPDAIPPNASVLPVSPGSVVWIPLDLVEFVRDPVVRIHFAQQVRRHLAVETPSTAASEASNETLPPEESSALPPFPLPLTVPLSLSSLINCSALQRLGSTADVTADDWQRTLDVNLSAPFWLTQTFLPELEAARGCVINIGSIHARLTKPGFVAYATSKAALDGMTRALAVDLGGRVRVNAIAPAAISTPMLEAGFEGRPEARRRLDEYHPAGRIGSPAEVARLARFIAEADGFLTGSTLALDGAIASRLHDPA
jgi:NAD(P)-dependent dehydrogenase (short-subunit alcohol dehydrogenase family)